MEVVTMLIYCYYLFLSCLFFDLDLLFKLAIMVFFRPIEAIDGGFLTI